MNKSLNNILSNKNIMIVDGSEYMGSYDKC